MQKLVYLFLLLESWVMGQTLGHPPNEGSSPPRLGTVVFVHGFMRSSQSMSALVYSFKKDGWHTENWAYPSRQKLIEEHAADLIDTIKAISQQKPNHPISFVTHSMGSLVVKCALNHPECPREAKIGRAVLIAPPNRGSMLARQLYKYRIARKVFGEKAGKQLMTTSLDGFDRLGHFPDHMPIMVIGGTAGCNPLIPHVNDGKVALEETCLKTPHFHKTCFAGHSWICHCPSTIKKTRQFLSFSR